MALLSVFLILLLILRFDTPMEAGSLRNLYHILGQFILRFPDNAIVDLLAAEELLNSAHGDEEFNELAKEPRKLSEWTINNCKNTYNGICDW